MAKPSWIGQTIGGRYEIEELLGKGGMSAVYRAKDPNLRRIVAVKLIHTHLSDDPSFVRRFEEEAATVAQLRHPNIIQVFDFAADEGVYYIVFEFIPGESLHQRLERTTAAGRKMDTGEAISIAAAVADALNYAHARNIVHRDVKPANVMINVQKEPILMDFGIVKIVGGTQHTATGATIGTARYMAPEQVRSDGVDRRTDIYSLGVMLYEMLAGRPPFQADSAMTMMMMHISDPVPDLSQYRPEVPPALRQIVNKSLAKDPRKRFQTAGEMAAALRQIDLSAPMAAVGLASAAATIVEPLPSQVYTAQVEPASAPAGGQPAPRVQTPPPSFQQPQPPKAGPPASPASPASSGTNRTPLLLAAGGIALVVLMLICVAGAIAFGPSLFGGAGEEKTPVAEATTAGEIPPAPTPCADQADSACQRNFRAAMDIWLAKAVPATPTPCADQADATCRTDNTAAQSAARETTIPLMVTHAYAVELSQRQSGADGEATGAPTSRPAATVIAAATEIAATATTAVAATTAAPTVAPTATSPPPTPVPPTATDIPPTATAPQGPSVQITGITLSGSQYVVAYVTYGYTPQLPGQHIHFFFDTVPPTQAGVPGGGPWKLYGGPSPFTEYGVGDRPGSATQMCSLVANADHSVIQGTGNCMALP